MLDEFTRSRHAGRPVALPSVCSAHPEVLTAALILARDRGQPVLIEATSNQVNHLGGYTGLTPQAFIDSVQKLCAQWQVPTGRVHFGGDHLGPQAWRHQPAAVAMAEATRMLTAYVQAGFTKIHLDCSEGCAGEAAQVGDAISAARAAQLAAVCEAAAGAQAHRLEYVIGTEVPVPGGVRATGEDAGLQPTRPDAARQTIAAHHQAFHAQSGAGAAAWSRVRALVVQPGVEFGPESLEIPDRTAPDPLAAVLREHPGLSLEAHSTDYQAESVLAWLAGRGFTVLKVGPALTFALRQCLYALDRLSDLLGTRPPEHSTLPDTMERLMLAQPGTWQGHHQGHDPQRLRLLRHYSYADRIRYHWADPAAQSAVHRLMTALAARPYPMEPLLLQVLPAEVVRRARALASARTPDQPRLAWPQSLVLASIQDMLLPYFRLNPCDASER